MDRSQTQFLELLRACLLGIAANSGDFKPGSVDWRVVPGLLAGLSLALVHRCCREVCCGYGQVVVQCF